MTDEDIFGPSRPFTPTTSFLGDDGYAEQIRKLAYKVMGEYERDLIPLDSEVAWMAGKTHTDVLEMINNDPSLGDAHFRNGPYAMTDEEIPGERTYLGTRADWQKVEDEVERVLGWWADNLGPDPDKFDDIVKSSADAAKAIYDESTGVGAGDAPWQSASTALEDWRSVAARGFRDHYWNRLPSIIRRQAGAAAILAHSVSAQRAMWSRHRNNFEDIAKKTLTAIEAVKVEEPNNAAADLTVLAGLLTVVAGAATIPFTAGATTGAVIAGVSTIASGAATVGAGEASRVEGERNQVELGADTVSSVLFNMAAAGGEATTEIREAESFMVKGLSGMYDTMTGTEVTDESGVDTSDLPDHFQPDDTGRRQRDLYVFPAPAMIGTTENLPQPPIAT